MLPQPVFQLLNGNAQLNTLILLHGLGDTHIPFLKLGQQLNLPETAIVALRAPERVPFLYEESFQWFPSFTPLGDLIQSPNPSSAIQYLADLIADLQTSSKIHLFGFAQGASVAAEFSLRNPTVIASVVAINGPLISYHTNTASNTPILVFHRTPPSESALPKDAIKAFRKGFRDVEQVEFKGEGIPASKEEWTPIMRFWSRHLRRAEDVPS